MTCRLGVDVDGTFTDLLLVMALDRKLAQQSVEE